MLPCHAMRYQQEKNMYGCPWQLSAAAPWTVLRDPFGYSHQQLIP